MLKSDHHLWPQELCVILTKCTSSWGVIKKRQLLSVTMVNALVEHSPAEVQTRESLGRCSIVSYGAGHMLNDITSACWFTYLLLFLTDIGLSPREAALVMFSGQTADAFTTIFAGEMVPALTYICSFAVSVILQEIRWDGWRLKVFFIVGAIIWMFSGAGIFILQSNMHNFMYIISIFIGVANALMTVTCISMQSILVGRDLNGCAFVYGSLSFIDKLSCGLALYALESYQVSPRMTCCRSIRGYLSVARLGSGLIPASCALLSAVITYTMELHDTTGSGVLVEPLLV